MSPPKDKKARVTAMKRQDYDANPPCCGNCARMKKAKPPQQMHHRCGIGGFNNWPGGICDKWTSPTGETLTS